MSTAVLNAFLDDTGKTITVVEPDPQKDEGVRRRRIRAEYVSFHRKDEVPKDLMRSLKHSEMVSSVSIFGSWVRVGWVNEFVRRQGRHKFKDMGIGTYEGDVDPVRYWMVETKAKVATPRRCYLDIETDSRLSFAQKAEMRLLVWAVSDETGPVASGVLESDTDESEHHLLSKLWDVLGNYDQVCAWYGGNPGDKDWGFDFYVIAQRTMRAGLPIDYRRWLWLDQLVVWRRMNYAETGDEKESMRLEDIAQNQIGEGKEATPEWVVKKFGDKGLGALAWDLWAAGGKYRELLHDYCVKDTELLRKLEARKGFLRLFQTVCEVCNVFGDNRGLNPTGQVDGLLLPIGRERDHIFGTKTYDKSDGKKKEFEGAFVLAPKSVPDSQGKWSVEQAAKWRKEHGLVNGILRNVHVCDFASLYPSVIVTWNLSEETIVEDPDILGTYLADDRQIPENVCRSPGTGVLSFTDSDGILVAALRMLLDMRKKWSDIASKLPPGTSEWLDAMARSNAYKVVANSFYGVFGSRFSRYFRKEVAESTTQNGVWLIKKTMEEGEKRMIESVAGDTDSAFVIGPSREGFASFVKWLNTKYYPKILKETGCKENLIKLTYEKMFDILVFSAKKRYCGRFAHYKWNTTCNRCKTKKGSPGSVDVRTLTCADCGFVYKEPPPFIGKPEIKGLEYRRGDVPQLARRFQGQIIDLLVGGLNLNPDIEVPNHDVQVYHDLIAKWRTRVLTEPLSVTDVRKSQALSKPLKEFKSATPAVTIAKILESRGQTVEVKSKIDYVVVDGDCSPMKVIPAVDYNGECDRFYLWDTLVYPPTQRLLEGAFPDVDWEKWAKVRPPKQRGKKKKVSDEQLGLALAAKRKEEESELAMPSFSSTPLVVRVPESGGKEMLEKLHAVFKEHPGARHVEIVIVLNTGTEAVLRTPLRVASGAEFKAAVDAVINAVIKAPAPVYRLRRRSARSVQPTS